VGCSGAEGRAEVVVHRGPAFMMLLGTKRGQSSVFRLLIESGEFLVYGIKPGPKC